MSPEEVEAMMERMKLKNDQIREQVSLVFQLS